MTTKELQEVLNAAQATELGTLILVVVLAVVAVAAFLLMTINRSRVGQSSALEALLPIIQEYQEANRDLRAAMREDAKARESVNAATMMALQNLVKAQEVMSASVASNHEVVVQRLDKADTERDRRRVDLMTAVTESQTRLLEAFVAQITPQITVMRTDLDTTRTAIEQVRRTAATKATLKVARGILSRKQSEILKTLEGINHETHALTDAVHRIGHILPAVTRPDPDRPAGWDTRDA